jgi:hypothetical protein
MNLFGIPVCVENAVSNAVTFYINIKFTTKTVKAVKPKPAAKCMLYFACTRECSEAQEPLGVGISFNVAGLIAGGL